MKEEILVVSKQEVHRKVICHSLTMYASATDKVSPEGEEESARKLVQKFEVAVIVYDMEPTTQICGSWRDLLELFNYPPRNITQF